MKAQNKMDILISGLLLAGTYALIALGLNLQYGVARIMNLANGEMLVLGALAAFWLFVSAEISPLLTIFLVAPISFAGNWLIYTLLLRPLVKRCKSQGQLEVGSILATFGMSFILVGINVPRISALAFAIGGAVTSVGGSLISTFIMLIDPGLTLAAAYLIFLLVLLFRPQGLFRRRPT
jgi:branched-subunit amino acid ABC-type transport system permease component